MCPNEFKFIITLQLEIKWSTIIHILLAFLSRWIAGPYRRCREDKTIVEEQVECPSCYRSDHGSHRIPKPPDRNRGLFNLQEPDLSYEPDRLRRAERGKKGRHGFLDDGLHRRRGPCFPDQHGCALQRPPVYGFLPGDPQG